MRIENRGPVSDRWSLKREFISLIRPRNVTERRENDAFNYPLRNGVITAVVEFFYCVLV